MDSLRRVFGGQRKVQNFGYHNHQYNRHLGAFPSELGHPVYDPLPSGRIVLYYSHEMCVGYTRRGRGGSFRDHSDVSNARRAIPEISPREGNGVSNRLQRSSHFTRGKKGQKKGQIGGKNETVSQIVSHDEECLKNSAAIIGLGTHFFSGLSFFLVEILKLTDRRCECVTALRRGRRGCKFVYKEIFTHTLINGIRVKSFGGESLFLGGCTNEDGDLARVSEMPTAVGDFSSWFSGDENFVPPLTPTLDLEKNHFARATHSNSMVF